MFRRLYFLFPDGIHARRVVSELTGARVGCGYMHALAKPGVDLKGLPGATRRQRTDLVRRIERGLWNLNLGTFFVALGLLIASLVWGFVSWPWLAIMLLSFLGGNRFATRIPNAHLDEMVGALSHGEILLMVDVPVRRVAEIEALVHRHPEADPIGTCWNMHAFGL